MAMVYDDKFVEFMSLCTAMRKADFINKGYTQEPDKLIYSEGKKYIKVMTESKSRPGKGGSVFCFIDKKTGDIYKPAGWAAPAKHVRGNIFDPNCMSCMTVYGPQYLR